MTVDVVGAITVDALLLLILGICVARITGRDELAKYLGIACVLVLVPLFYLLAAAFGTSRSGFYFVWLALLAFFVLFEVIGDAIMRIDFGNARWAVISYAILFFTMIWGVVGISAKAGQAWFIATIVFTVAAVAAFVQRGISGL